MEAPSAYNILLEKLGITNRNPKKRVRSEEKAADFDVSLRRCGNLEGNKGCTKTLTECTSHKSKRLRPQLEKKQGGHERVEVSSGYSSLLDKFEGGTNSLATNHQQRKGKDGNVPDFDEEGTHLSTCDKYGGTDDVEVDANDASEDGVGRVVCTNSSQCESTFDSHVEHKLSEEDIEKLLKREWKYTWDMPASGLTNCMWKGTGDSYIKDVDATAPYGLKKNLYERWLEVCETKRGEEFHSSQQRLFFSLCNTYRDILHSKQKAFYQKESEKVSCCMDAYIMHSLNHVFKSRDLVVKNNAKLTNIDAISGDGFCDQGFTRAKVLFLLPLPSVALCLVKRLIQLTPSSNKVNVDYMDRFTKDFESFRDKGKDIFVVGVKFTRKSIKLYSDLNSSDMIIASPLGLVQKFADAKACKEKHVDYLSSIEILIVDHADLLLMQNWGHVKTVVERLNCLPSKPTKTDIGRIRHWSWNARFYRQTIILGSYLNPDINGLFNNHCLNFEGKLLLSCEYKGVMSKILLDVQQVYRRFHVESKDEADNDRWDYFVKKIWPTIKKESQQGGIMLFSSYLDFIRINKYLKEEDVSFCSLPEYKDEWSDISRARNWFLQGHSKIMLYTERSHFYRRFKIRGIRKIYFYSLPERAKTYSEILNMLEGSETMNCTVLFSELDRLRLERVVGTELAKQMTKPGGDIFIVKSGSSSNYV